jgi:hypothetical protein
VLGPQIYSLQIFQTPADVPDGRFNWVSILWSQFVNNTRLATLSGVHLRMCF